MPASCRVNHKLALVLACALLGHLGIAKARPPGMGTTASISPSTYSNDSAAGQFATATASVSTSSRTASATASGSGSLATSATASDGGISELASGAASVTYFLRLLGPTGTSLNGKLSASMNGFGQTTSRLGDKGSQSLASLHYSFRTAAHSAVGSVQFQSVAGISDGGATGSALIGSIRWNPTVKIGLTTPLFSAVITPGAEDWLYWGLPPPQASVFPIESLSSVSGFTGDLLTSIQRAIDLNGILGYDYDPALAQVDIGVDSAYAFDGSASVDLSMATGRSDVLTAFVSTDANSTSGGAAQAQTFGRAGAPTELGGLSFVVAAAGPIDLSQYHLIVDGTDFEIPIIPAVPETGTLAMISIGLLCLRFAMERERELAREAEAAAAAAADAAAAAQEASEARCLAFTHPRPWKGRRWRTFCCVATDVRALAVRLMRAATAVQPQPRENVRQAVGLDKSSGRRSPNMIGRQLCRLTLERLHRRQPHQFLRLLHRPVQPGVHVLQFDRHH